MKVREGYHSEQMRNKSFGEILDSLNCRQREVYHVIKNYGPICNEDIADILEVFPHKVTPRVLELRKAGIVEFAGESTSQTSSRSVSLWKIKIIDRQYELFKGA